MSTAWREVERRLDRRAGDGDDRARERQLLVGEPADLGAEDEGGQGAGRILGEPGGELSRIEHRDAQPPVAAGGGAHHPPERRQGLVEAATRAMPSRTCPAPDGESGRLLADLRRGLDQDQPVEPHVGHGPRRRPDVALLAGTDEDDGGGTGGRGLSALMAALYILHPDPRDRGGER